ncbi:PTS ascorbate transporter subunit IIC [Candidatus Cryosericum septentrionale]|jgi:PTS system ascorbate-specific IIC component|uniref:Ascorbate-specific PTS system EIIC component n=1 Tax=Candidatus Cryosericum septentrionale TaxID=2290913 RepID=A0A398DVX4_9BACT|nr:PTS ascorbate transporter subunit IIC [Candidatus Cryosericum septentrionale]RIE16278.1 PTS ascorbate transporter subunit IIC [Candidatus Cryosericum septentrionale]
MGVINAIIAFVTLPAIMLGIIALVGLLLQKKPASEVISGTFKTVLGLLILGIGTGALIAALNPIQQLFQLGIPTSSKLITFVTFDEGVVGAVQSGNIGNIGTELALTMLFGYIIHILLARFTKFKYLYLTGHMIWIHAGAFALLFHSFGLPLWQVVLYASIVDGLYMTLSPALAQPIMRKITGTNDVAFGHGQTSLNMVCAWLGKLVGKPEDSAEKVKVKDSLSFFRDMAISISLIMLIVSLIAGIMAVARVGSAAVEKQVSGGQNWVVFAILQGLGFTAGVLVLLQGVRMLIAEIVPAFKGIGEKFIKGAIPALDCPVIYPFAPNSLVYGLISGVIGQVVGMITLALIGWPIPLPSMIAAFFASGSGAIFGNATGGRRGAWLGGFVWGFVGWLMISFAYKFQVFGNLSALGATSLGFTCPDAIIPSTVIWLVAKLFGV